MRTTMLRSLIPFFVVLQLAASCVGQIQVRVRTGAGLTADVLPSAVPYGAPVTVTTAQLASAAGRTSPMAVWVYDVAALTGAPLGDIGTVSIEIDPNDFVLIEEIRFIVARPPTVVTASPLDTLESPNPDGDGAFGDFKIAPERRHPNPGARNFRSLAVDPLLLPTTRAVIAVTGDVGIDPALNNGVRDTITVGQVYRIQANGRTEFVNGQPTLVGGDIHADITAFGEDEEIFG